MALNAAAKKWVKALRSGEYQQVKNQLRNITKDGEYGFCCLGVACELAQKARIIETYRPSNGGLPQKVAKWLGLASEMGDIEGGRKYHDLAEYNDYAAYNFKQIADLIESEPKGLFKNATKDKVRKR